MCRDCEKRHPQKHSSRFCEGHTRIRTTIHHADTTQHVFQDRVLMTKARSKTPPSSKKKRKQKLERLNEKLVAENGMTMAQRAAKRRFDGVLIRQDVAALTRSRDDAQKAAGVARESKKRAHAAKRSAEKVADKPQNDAKEQQRLREMATVAAEAEHALRVRAEEDGRAAKKKLEEERRRVQLLVEDMARLALEI